MTTIAAQTMSAGNRAIVLPSALYHGSAFHTEDLQPGFNRTGELREWDRTESNHFLYATTEAPEAYNLGFASAIEHAFGLDRFQSEGQRLTIHTPKRIVEGDLLRLDLWVYTIVPRPDHHWAHNHNAQNSIQTEYKTATTVDYVSAHKVDMRRWLEKKQIRLNPK